MAFVHEQSCECMKGELDLFSVPPTQTSIEHGTWVEYHPLATISHGAPIEFEVSGTGDSYIDFGNSHLYVKAKITTAGGGDIADDAKVGGVNNFLHSLFSQVDISLNGTLITSSTGTYPYRSYIESLLSYGPAAKQSQLTAALFYKDTAGKMDVGDPYLANGAYNVGLHQRASFTAGSKTVDLIGRIHSDIFFQDRYMLNEVNTKIRLVRSKDSFSLITSVATLFKVKILSAVLIIRKVKLCPSVFIAHAKTLEHGLAKYPIRRVVCKSFTVPTGYLDASHEKLFSGQLPSRVVIGCVDNDAFNGAYARNPFNFKHLNLSEISLYLDGQQHAIKPMQTNFEGEQFIRAYASLYSGTGKENRDEGNDIARSDFSTGYALYAFDLSPDLAEEGHFNLTRQGGVRIDIKFAAALPNTVTIVAYAEFENVIEIDRNRNVVFDFGS
jgi:hypothetical protein